MIAAPQLSFPRVWFYLEVTFEVFQWKERNAIQKFESKEVQMNIKFVQHISVENDIALKLEILREVRAERSRPKKLVEEIEVVIVV